jgi:hypothetical protein
MNNAVCIRLVLATLMTGLCAACNRQDSSVAQPVGQGNAAALLNDALVQAESEDKRVFIHLGAPW